MNTAPLWFAALLCLVLGAFTGLINYLESKPQGKNLYWFYASVSLLVLISLFP